LSLQEYFFWDKRGLDGRWNEVRFMQGVEVEGKTLGIIGLGRIGKRVAEKAQALGMRIMFYDPYVAGEYVPTLFNELFNAFLNNNSESRQFNCIG
jgi:phosphoglycerate dehydrogenase-like enzyme